MRKKVLVFTLTGGIAAVIVLCTVSSAAVKKGTCAPLPLLKIIETGPAVNVGTDFMSEKHIEAESYKAKSAENTWLCIQEKMYSAITGEEFDSTSYSYVYDKKGMLLELRSDTETPGELVSRYTYDKKGNCILQSDYTFGVYGSTLVCHEEDIEYSYNNANELVKEKHYYSANSVVWSEEYLYNKGLLQEMRQYEGSDLNRKEEYKYTSDGLLKEKDFYGGSALNEKEVYEYENGMLIKIESSHQADWDYIRIHHFEYDSEGKVIKEWYDTSKDPVPDLIVTYEYNERGEKIKCTEDYSDFHNNATGDNRQRDLFYSYEYDENGNMTKEIKCDESWNPSRITEYTYINKNECVTGTVDEYIGLFKLNFMGQEPFINLVRLKQGRNLDKIQCSYNVSGTYSEKVNISLDINGVKFQDTIDFNGPSDLVWLYAVDLNISEIAGNIVAVVEGENDTKKSVFYAYGENEIIKLGEIDGDLDVYSLHGDGAIATNEALRGGILSTGKFVAHRSGRVKGFTLSAGEATVGHYEETDNGKVYQDGFSFSSDADLTVYQEPGYEQAIGVIPAGSEIKMLKYTVTDVIYHGAKVTEDAFYVSSGDISGWTTNTDIREAAEDYYVAG